MLLLSIIVIEVRGFAKFTLFFSLSIWLSSLSSREVLQACRQEQQDKELLHSSSESESDKVDEVEAEPRLPIFTGIDASSLLLRISMLMMGGYCVFCSRVCGGLVLAIVVERGAVLYALCLVLLAALVPVL